MQPQTSSSWNHGVPVPCSRCGAPMQLVHGQAAHASLALFCAYCHRNEALSPDAAERVRYLQQRLALLKQARENDEAPLRSVATLRRAWLPVLLFFGLLTLHTLYKNFTLMSSLRQTAPEAVGHLLAPLAIQMGLFGGYVFGYLGMSVAYQRAVRPLLRAKPPVAAGVALRCRSCGADLPSVSAPHVVCGYCSAHNLLDAQVTRRASELLREEMAAYQARANGVYAADAFRAPNKAFYRWGVVSALAIALLVAVALRLILPVLGLVG